MIIMYIVCVSYIVYIVRLGEQILAVAGHQPDHVLVPSDVQI